jgi:hypothetical protein
MQSPTTFRDTDPRDECRCGLRVGWHREQDLNLSRLAGVSEAGACWRDPERSEGPSEGGSEVERE